MKLTISSSQQSISRCRGDGSHAKCGVLDVDVFKRRRPEVLCCMEWICISIKICMRGIYFVVLNTSTIQYLSNKLQKLSQKTGESRLFLLFILQSSVFSLYIYTSSKNQRTSTGYLIIYEGLHFFFFNLQFLIYIYIYIFKKSEDFYWLSELWRITYLSKITEDFFWLSDLWLLLCLSDRRRFCP